MLRLLADEHISPVVARQLRVRIPEMEIVSLQEWNRGTFLGCDDEELLSAAAESELTLISYDLRTLAPLLKAWGEAGRSHGGVILIDEVTIAPNDFGGLIRALSQLWQAEASKEWTDQVLYLRAG